jgi:hypothetical protein
MVIEIKNFKGMVPNEYDGYGNNTGYDFYCVVKTALQF